MKEQPLNVERWEQVGRTPQLATKALCITAITLNVLSNIICWAITNMFRTAHDGLLRAAAWVEK